MLDLQSPSPLYAQLKKLLLERIVEGEYLPGEEFPAEKEIELQYGVSRITVRRALSDLADAGYLTRYQGRRTVVANPKITHNLATIGGLGSDLAAQGFAVRSRVLYHERRPAPDSVASMFGVPKGHQVLCERRVIFANEVPLVLGASFHNVAEGVEFSDQEVEGGYVLTLLKSKYGVKFRRLERTTEAVVTNSEEAALLGVEAGTTLLKVSLKLFGDGPKPVSFVQARYRGDRYQYRQVLDLEP